MSIREDIATAATVDGVTEVTPYYRQGAKPGQGMVRLDRVARDASGLGRIATWQVIVFLPQAIATAEAWLDENTTTLLDAIGAELVVLSATPSQVSLDTGTAPALVIEGAREYH